MDNQRTEREGSGGMNRTAKTIAIGTLSSLAGGICAGLLIGVSRETWLWMIGYCVVLAPLSIWGGLIIKRYLFPTT
jgi:hypothetical protein